MAGRPAQLLYDIILLGLVSVVIIRRVVFLPITEMVLGIR